MENQITDKQIQDSLWYYYYDIEKTVKYLVKTYLEPPKEKKAAKKTKGGFFLSFPFWQIVERTCGRILACLEVGMFFRWYKLRRPTRIANSDQISRQRRRNRSFKTMLRDVLFREILRRLSLAQGPL